MKKINLEKSWDAAAEIFFEEWEPIFSKGLTWGPYGPWEKDVKLLPPLRNKKVLVLGCGSGPDVWWLAKHGAKVTGVDFSQKQLGLAKTRMKKARLKAVFIKKNLNKLSTKDFSKNSFDLIISNYALMYVENLDRLFAVVSLFLKNGGKFVFSLDHPVWGLLRPTRRGGVKQTLKSLDYFKEEKSFFKMSARKGEAIFYLYGRTVGRIVNALSGNGLFIEKMLEPKPASHLITGYYKKWVKFADKMPATIILVSRKIK